LGVVERCFRGQIRLYRAPKALVFAVDWQFDQVVNYKGSNKRNLNGQVNMHLNSENVTRETRGAHPHPG
jgi:hypothetical protein